MTKASTLRRHLGERGVGARVLLRRANLALWRSDIDPEPELAYADRGGQDVQGARRLARRGGRRATHRQCVPALGAGRRSCEALERALAHAEASGDRHMRREVIELALFLDSATDRCRPMLRSRGARSCSLRAATTGPRRPSSRLFLAAFLAMAGSLRRSARPPRRRRAGVRRAVSVAPALGVPRGRRRTKGCSGIGQAPSRS